MVDARRRRHQASASPLLHPSAYFTRDQLMLLLSSCSATPFLESAKRIASRPVGSLGAVPVRVTSTPLYAFSREAPDVREAPPPALA